MKVNRRATLGLLASAPVAIAAAEPAPPTNRRITIFEAKRIVTMEPAQPQARFVAVADGMILGVADSVDALSVWPGERTLDRRFADKVLMPGLIDPHVHPAQTAVMLNIPFLAPDDWNLPSGRYPGVRNASDYWQRLKVMLAASDARPFITWGYHNLFHGPMSRAMLDAIAPDRPVVIWQRSFHDIYVNSAMLKEWGYADKASLDAAVKAAGVDPHHVDHERGCFSETGLLMGLDRLRPVILSGARISAGMAGMMTMLAKSGVTTISDMGTGMFAGFDTEAQMIGATFNRPGAAARVMLMPVAAYVDATTDLDAWMESIRTRFASPGVRIDRRVKMLADGAFFAQNMRMNAPGYTDGHIGKWITEPDILNAQFQRFWAAGFSLHIHVNGDEGLDVVLDALARLAPRPAQTITLEHLGYSTEAQNRRIIKMGLMVSAQPNYIRVLGDAYAATGLGPDRAAAMNRLASLEQGGVPLGLHSDFNMAPIDPLYLAWIASNRETLDGHVKGPAERLSLDKALRAITIEAAQVIGMDALVGSIASGKRADFAVLDKDPYDVGAAALRDIKVEGVIFEGRFSAAG